MQPYKEFHLLSRPQQRHGREDERGAGALGPARPGCHQDVRGPDPAFLVGEGAEGAV